MFGFEDLWYCFKGLLDLNLFRFDDPSSLFVIVYSIGAFIRLDKGKELFGCFSFVLLRLLC